MITWFYGNCYKLTTILTNQYMIEQKQLTDILIYFNQSITEEKFPKEAKLFLTSEKNSYGIVISDWRNGKVTRSASDRGQHKGFYLKPVQHSYETTNPKCSHESFHDCMSKSIAAILKGSQSQCSAVSMPLLPICKINKTIEEEKEFWEAWHKSDDQCFSNVNCIILEYSADKVFSLESEQENITFKFTYRMPTNSTTIYEEYWIYDEINAIASVGGTLGMCIGFSFTSLVSSLINILQYLLLKQKCSKPKGQKSRRERRREKWSNILRSQML